jgi:L-lactate dehydrogenase complex protein LldG
MSDAREEILGRIRVALKDAPVGVTYNEINRGFQRTGVLDREASLHLLKDRLLDYDSDIFEVTTEAEIAGAVAQALQRGNEQQVLVAEAFPTAWLPSGIEVVVDKQLTTQQLDGIATVVTTCEAAVAATGTIILVHEGAQGRRAITLLPDHHVCIVSRSQIFELWPEAVVSIDAESRKAITTISGPSATSDIEMTRIRGVHGPRRLSVIFYG